MMGLFDFLGKALNPLSIITGGDSSVSGAMDFIDPGNLMHEGASQRMANEQWQMEKFWNERNYNEQKRQFDANFAEQQKYNDLNYAEQKRQFDLNYAEQQRAYDYQVALNNLQMEREDTAVQRRVADLKAAGLSPTLAAGAAAGSTPVHAGNAPQHGVAQHGISQHDVAQGQAPSDVRVRAAMFKEQMARDKMALLSTMLGNFANISKTMAETKYIEEKTNETTADIFLKEQLQEFNEAMNPYRLKEEVGKVRLQDEQSIINGLNSALLEEQRGYAVYREVQNRVGAKLTEANLSYRQKEIAEKAIAIALLDVKDAQAREDFNYSAWTYEFAREYGVPLSIMNDTWIKRLLLGNETANKLFGHGGGVSSRQHGATRAF